MKGPRRPHPASPPNERARRASRQLCALGSAVIATQRACAALIGALLAIASAARADEPPAPAPKEGTPEKQERERSGFDAEGDYLALADAPLFLPRSYLYWGTPVGPRGARQDLVFGLEYALHLPIFSNLRDRALSGQRWAGAVTLSFEGDLRMLAVRSKPVRMPSYRPNLSGQLFYLWHRENPVLTSLRSGAYHYSNGQEQCTFSEPLRDQSPECTAATDQVSDPERQLNRKNGDFTSNGWLLELYARLHQVNSKGVAFAHFGLGLTMAALIDKGPGSMEAALKRLYGWGRVGAVCEGKRRFGWATTTVRAGVAFYPDSGPRIPSVAGNVELVLGPYWLTGLGFFARYHGGRDFYNAFFVDRLQQFAAGLAWDGERPLKFKRE